MKNVMLSTSEDLLMGYFDDVVLAIDLSISFSNQGDFLVNVRMMHHDTCLVLLALVVVLHKTGRSS